MRERYIEDYFIEEDCLGPLPIVGSDIVVFGTDTNTRGIPEYDVAIFIDEIKVDTFRALKLNMAINGLSDRYRERVEELLKGGV